MTNLKTYRANAMDLKVGQRFIDSDFTYIYEVIGRDDIGCVAKVVGSTHPFLFSVSVVNVIEEDK